MRLHVRYVLLVLICSAALVSLVACRPRDASVVSDAGIMVMPSEVGSVRLMRARPFSGSMDQCVAVFLNDHVALAAAHCTRNATGRGGKPDVYVNDDKGAVIDAV